MGKAISVEVWEDDDIVGGLYGLDLDDILWRKYVLKIF